MYETLRIQGLLEERRRICTLEVILQAEAFPAQNALNISGDRVAYFLKKVLSILVQHV
jgi:hypothetical protein